jgi:aminoglycoside phosphotransferase (APT) family kinase protein
MTDVDFQKRLIAYIEGEFKFSVVSTQIPPQGMSSSVFFIKTMQGKEYAVKHSIDATKDILAFSLISREHISVPVPSVLGSFLFEGVPVLILEKIQFPLLESVPIEEMSKYISSMIENLRKLHTIKSASSGLLNEPNSQKTWKEIMLDIFTDNKFYWQDVARREGVDGCLITTSVENVIKKINTTEFKVTEYSLLHTDFNQRNLFVNPENYEIAGIIDWEDAMYGDPIYDFARVRMYLWHFNLGDEAVKKYYEIVDFTPQQKELEDLYWLSRIIQYLGWYSEELNEFTKGRIKLHQDYLRCYDWLKKF